MQKTLYLDAIEIPNVPAVEDGQKAPLKFLSQDWRTAISEVPGNLQSLTGWKAVYSLNQLLYFNRRVLHILHLDNCIAWTSAQLMQIELRHSSLLLGFVCTASFRAKPTAREGDRGFVSQIQKTLLKRIEKVSWMVVSVKNCENLGANTLLKPSVMAVWKVSIKCWDRRKRHH